VALAIFLFALVAIGRLVTVGGDRAVDVQLQSRATQLCQSKLAEVIAGVVPLSAQAEVPFDEDPDWQWSLDVSQGSVTGLWTVTVRVSREGAGGSKVQASLSQMIVDPSIRGSSTTSTPGSSSGGGSSGGSGSSSSGGGSGMSGGGGAAGAGMAGGGAAAGSPSQGGKTP
jgi:hypothetical protein